MIHLTKIHSSLRDTPLNSAEITEVHDTSDDEDTLDPDITCKDGIIPFLKARGYWKHIKMTFFLVVHFLVVLLVLFCSAVGFAYLEDVDYLNGSNAALASTKNSTTVNFTRVKDAFWNRFEEKYNLNLTDETRATLIDEFKQFIEEENENLRLKDDISQDESERMSDKMYIFRKWFYFVVITATTIGYGDVTPKTKDGKLFYIFFSLVAIILVMSLLQRCGAFISMANRQVYAALNRYFCRYFCAKGREFISKEVLSLISILVILIVYLVIGIQYGHDQAENNWKTIDSIYFWVVTFTTVGFGEMTYPLHQELDNMPFFIIYRIFGLALVAAVIDAIVACVNMDEINANRAKLTQRLQGLRDEAKMRAEMALSKADAAITKANPLPL